VLVQQVTATSMASAGSTGTVPALIAEAKGRGHSTCEGWVKNHGKPTKETLELFFLKHLKHFYRLSRSFLGIAVIGSDSK